MANMLADKIADKEIRVIYGIPESTSFGYAADINNGKKIRRCLWDGKEY